MIEISWLHLVVLILSAFRLTHLLVFDEIMSAVRKHFINVRYEDEGGQTTEHIEIKGTGWRRWIGSVLSCFWCAGVWCSIIVVILYMFVPASFPLLVILAVAGAAAIIETRI